MGTVLFYSLPQLLPLLIFFLLMRREKLKTGLSAWLVIFLYLTYNLLVPVVDFLSFTHSFLGYTYPLSEVLQPEMTRVYALGWCAFLAGYFLLARLRHRRMPEPENEADGRYFPVILTGIQILVWALIFMNYHLSGIDLLQILNPENREESNILFSANWAIPGLDLLSNCLPVCLYLQWRFSRKWYAGWMFLFIIWLILSLLSGWRYRIILFFLFMVLHQLRFHTWKIQHLSLIFFAGLLIFSWLTLNRMAIAKRQFDLITFDLSRFDMGIFTNEFSNSRTFRATLIYLKNHPESQSDGLSWFRFLGNKFKPKNSFPDRVRPKPWILEVTKAWIPLGWPWNPNPAVTQMEEFFLTFGYSGILLGMLLLGFWTFFLDIPVQNSVIQCFKIVCMALLFQWTTRGFFLYQVQISAVCIFPLAVLYIMKPYLPHGSARNKA
jgi:hypothetical protein